MVESERDSMTYCLSQGICVPVRIWEEGVCENEGGGSECVRMRVEGV